MLLGWSGAGASALSLCSCLLRSPFGLQAPKLKAALAHCSSEEVSGPCRRSSPFRVRFADESLQDTAFRYWERKCARKQAGWGEPGIPESSSQALGEQRLGFWGSRGWGSGGAEAGALGVGEKRQLERPTGSGPAEEVPEQAEASVDLDRQV